MNNFSYAVSELYYGINLRATVKKLQRFIPDISPNDVERWVYLMIDVLYICLMSTYSDDLSRFVA